MDYDKVIVLDKGELVEFGSPHELLSKSSGIFKDMCMETGEVDDLIEIARLKNALVQ